MGKTVNCSEYELEHSTTLTNLKGQPADTVWTVRAPMDADRWTLRELREQFVQRLDAYRLHLEEVKKQAKDEGLSKDDIEARIAMDPEPRDLSDDWMAAAVVGVFILPEVTTEEVLTTIPIPLLFQLHNDIMEEMTSEFEKKATGRN